MAEAVLDASAILAVLWAEAGAERIGPITRRFLVSVVNEAEVISMVVRRGSSPDDAVELVRNLPYELVDVDRHLARRAGALWQAMKPRGLSLGDRCCLALAEREGLPVITSDRSWANLPTDVAIQLIR